VKDFFGTVIEPGDAVVVARNAPGAGMVGELVQFTAGLSANGSLHLIDKTGERKNYSFGPHNVISMKSIARKD